MKKLLLSFTLFILSVSSIFADWGLGVEAGIETGGKFGSSFAVTARSDENPWCIAASAFPFDNKINVILDNWFVNENLSGIVDWYSFWGMSVHTGFNDFSLATGARIGIGLDWFILDNRQLEFYVQGAWNPYIGFNYKSSEWDFLFKPFCFPFTTGARWWLR